MLKEGQLVLLPCHEALGEVVFVNSEKAVIRYNTKDTNKVDDIVLTPDGLLPHTDVSMIEPILFKEGENIFVKPDKCSPNLMLGKIEKINIARTEGKLPEVVADVYINGNTNTIQFEIDRCYKLFELKKTVDKMVRENDRFHREENV